MLEGLFMPPFPLAGDSIAATVFKYQEKGKELRSYSFLVVDLSRAF